ncbi:silent information regulator protein Sir2 [Nitritalea halalkaliphila LW7]|uniref:NAD-dependent protein deacylase n=1 Tax=Nitritalea halalkaliphila LW7 TaxID=1189621 RepID=I5C391_9BACT|nr:Sir2 family NAD-dependent protein deacetylase [Nitritalea halalkaliphila]EIM76293.1 silent information regulator protein Sir2 [Nitritalea halalkaliphila LW7]
MKKKLVVFTGAGISAESGLKTFRDSDGLWEGHDVMQVATPEGWAANPELVLTFYNQRRQQAQEVLPNVAHQLLVELEADFDVHIITQNVDDLHERAGSSHVLHLHGELDKVQSTLNPDYIVSMKGAPISLGDCCPQGGQLRPYVVWFGEPVPAYADALAITREADIFLVIGTSLQVYPAAGLLYETPSGIPVFIVDRQIPDVRLPKNCIPLEGSACAMAPILKTQLLKLR